MESRQNQLWAVLFITFAAATIITILRFLSRRLKRITLSWDDYFALCGYVRHSFYSLAAWRFADNSLQAISLGWIIIIPYCRFSFFVGRRACDRTNRR